MFIQSGNLFQFFIFTAIHFDQPIYTCMHTPNVFVFCKVITDISINRFRGFGWLSPFHPIWTVISFILVNYIWGDISFILVNYISAVISFICVNRFWAVCFIFVNHIWAAIAFICQLHLRSHFTSSLSITFEQLFFHLCQIRLNSHSFHLCQSHLNSRVLW